MNSVLTFRSRLWRQIFCLLLTGSLWRGPMPVLHDHAELAEGTGLIRHLLQYHDYDIAAPAGGQTCQSHWHFAPLRDVLDPNAPPQKSGDDDISAFRLASTSGRFTDALSCGHTFSALPPSALSAGGQSADSSAWSLTCTAVSPGSSAGGRTILLRGMSFLL
ncbi:MAG: hypothetical protein ACKPJJ_05990 [Planctomycetaceae bacterium]